MKNYLMRKDGLNLFLFLAVVLLAALTGLCFIAGLSDSDLSASAYDIGSDSAYTYGNSSTQKKLNFGIDSYYNSTYSIPLSFDSEGAGDEMGQGDGTYKSGDIYSDSAIYLAKSQGDYWITSEQMKYSSLYIDLPIVKGGYLEEAIRDQMVDVSLQLYFQWGLHSEDDGGSEKCDCTYTYYTGDYEEIEMDGGGTTQKPITQSKTFDLIFDASNNSQGNYKYCSSFNLPATFVSAGNPFVRISFTNFQQKNNLFNISIRDMGIRVIVAPKTNINLELISVDIYDSTGMRNAAAGNNEVKPGDVVVLTSTILSNSGALDVDTNDLSAAATSYNGRFYRRFFMRGSADNIIRYIFHSNELTQITSYKNNNNATVDISSNHSGLVAAFRVENSTSTNLLITFKTWRSDNVETGIQTATTFLLDAYSANAPYLTDNIFFSKYIGPVGKSYFTDETSYLKGQDENDEEVITGVDLGTKGLASTPKFTNNALLSSGGDGVNYAGSTQVIYYKASVWDKEYQPTSSGEKSTGFALEEATGIYCTITPRLNTEATVDYGQLRLMLPTHWSGTVTTYDKTALFTIEFINVDYVGNLSYCPIMYFIRVDVTDYEFSYSKTLNVSSGGNTVSDTEVAITFTTLDDAGNPKPKATSKAVFKRGDKVLVYVKFTSQAMKEYALTNFNTQGYTINTEHNVYVNDTTSIQLADNMPYSFEVNSNFTDHPELRFLKFTFKLRATISITGTSQSYTGAGKEVTVVVTYKGTKVIGSISTTYSTEENGVYTSNLPVDVATYYVKCELKGHKSYYAYQTAVMTINPATPRINRITINPINYGQSLFKIDFNSNIAPSVFNTSILSLGEDGSYYFDRSYDGIYGYFKVNESRLNSNSNTYIKPSAGYLTVPLSFVPIEVEKNDEGEIVYSRDDDGKFIRDENYRQIDNISAEILVNYSTAVRVTVSDVDNQNTITYQYDGREKPISYTIRSTMTGENGEAISETNMNLIQYSEAIYETAPLDGATPHAVDGIPSDAGRYKVTVRLIEGNGCNYTGRFVYYLVVQKRALYIDMGTGSTDVTFRYQQETPFTPIASYGSGVNKVSYTNLNYLYTFYHDNGANNMADSALPENLVDESEFFVGTGMPQNAGRYVARVEIDETNFENIEDKYVRFTISQVDSGYESLVVALPTLRYNSGENNAHLNYMQKLSAVQLNTSSAYVQFDFHLYQRNKIVYKAEKIEGTFIVTHRTFRSAGHTTETVDEFVSDTQNYADYGNEPGGKVGRQRAYIYFIPNDRKNFLPIGRETEIILGKAVLSIEDVTVDPIVYGKAILTVDDLTITNNVKVNVSGSEYHVLDKSSADEGYEYSLVGIDSPKVYPAGEGNYVTVRVTPNRPDFYEVLLDTVRLTVYKQELSISFATNDGQNYVVEDGNRIYTYPYGGAVKPALSFSAIVAGQTKKYGDDAIRGTAVYTGETATYGATGTYSPANLPTGEYLVEYTVKDDNFSGSIFYRYVIVKDKLTVDSLPSIYDPTSVVTYNALMSSARFYSGTMKAKTTDVTVTGTYSFRYPEGMRFTRTGQRANYFLTFTPDDTDLYEEYYGDSFYLTLEVSKADLSGSIGLTVSNPIEGGFVYGELDATSDLVGYVDYTTSVYTNGSVYSYDQTPGYRKLDATISISGVPATGAIPVGNYAVTVSIDDPNYAGTAVDTTGIVILPRPAKIVLYADQNGETNEKIFRNRNQTVSYALYTVDDGGEYTRRVLTETVTQTFYLNGVLLRSAPFDIGQYDVVLTLRSTNYIADVLPTTLTIKVDAAQIRVTNLEQTYNVPRAAAVSLGLNDAVFTLSYLGEDGTKYDSLPTEAGKYEVHLHFDALSNNGYQEDIVYKENGEIKYLEISKYIADIIVNELVTTNYTGMTNDLRPSTEPFGLSLKIEYLAEGSEEWTEEEVFAANSDADVHHLVRFTVVDPNYTGTVTVRYHINRGDLTIVTHPIFDTFVYNDDEQPAVLERGRVDFNERTDLDGVYSLDIATIGVLPVSKHKVSYTFVAYTNGVPDTNFKPVVGQADLTIVKRTIEQEDFLLGVVSGNVTEYSGNNFVIDAAVREGAVLEPNGINADFRLILYYNNNVNAPRDPGVYSVRAVVSSRNYQGEYEWNKDLIINKGKPVISVNPIVKSNISYVVGQTVTTADLEIGSGRATVKDVGTTINGDFSLMTAVLSKANYNEIDVVFTPNDGERFETVRFTVTFFAVGTNPLPGVEAGQNWLDKTITVEGYGQAHVEVTSATHVVYGEKLSAFSLKFAGDTAAVARLNAFGMLTFVYPNSIPDAGFTQVAVRYTPYGENADVYTILEGSVNVTVEKAVLNDVSVRVVGFEGKNLSEAEFILMRGDDVLEIPGTTKYYSDSGRTAEITGSVPNGTVVYYTFLSNNYKDYLGETVVKVAEKLYVDNIEVGKTTKSFDGRALSYSDLYIRIVDTATTVNLASDVTLRVYDADGNRCEGIDVGTYTVEVYVENDLVFGHAETTYTITKRDVSYDMTLDRYSTVYASVAAPRAMVDDEYVDTATYRVQIQYKLATAGNASYNSNLPVRAGLYNVKVTVEGQNYSGESVFEYTVEKLPVRLVADSVYTFRYGSAGKPSISFRSVSGYDGVDLEYSVYYYSLTYSMSKSIPDTAGTYTARIVLEEDDYSISGQPYAEVSYVIEQMSSAITTPPTPLSIVENYHLLYGQTLSELSLYGGEATRNDVSIPGWFVVENETFVPNAGAYYATVRFLPTDKNYAESTTNIAINVGQASATVTFEKLVADYNGSSRRTALRWSVNPSNVDVSILFVNSLGETLTNPVAAGTYSLVVTSNDPNYKVTSTIDKEGNAAVFTIAKATVRSIIAPRANSITVGESVEKSSIVGGDDYGLVYYEGFSKPVGGTFEFLERSYVFTAAGKYEVEYVFFPTDGNNYAEGRGTTSIVVNKAVATVTVSDNEFVYASGFRYPTFSTYPAGLKVEHDITFRPYDPTAANYIYNEDDYVDVGTYEFHAWIVDDNYLSAVTEFRIIITKKAIDLDFVNDEGEVVQQYSTTYGIFPTVAFTLYPSGLSGKQGYLMKDEVRNGVSIYDTYEIRYQANEKGLVYDDHRPPVEIGTYTVSITLVSDNYTAAKTVLYKINKGKILSVEFNKDSIDNQVYGAVVEPIVLTEPSGIAYKIIYHGTNGGLLPTEAGSYNITIQFIDENYESLQVAAKFKIAKKPIYVTEITVEDKTYDGTPTLKVTGRLYGILPDDEISLTMTAQTADGSSAVGQHYVKITSCKLSGLQAGNYETVFPSYALPVTIFDNKVASTSGNSFITSTNGFEDGTTVEFHVINSDSAASTFFENLTGRSSKVIGYTVKENGADALISESFKVYVEIPTEFLEEDFEVTAVGALADKNVVFTREGNYITFYASGSGQIQFKKTEFSYTAIVILISIAAALLAIVALAVITPTVRTRKITDNSAEKALARRAKKGY